MDVLELPPLTGSPLLDPWRIRYRLLLAGELEAPRGRAGRGGVTPSERMLWEALEGDPDGWVREYVTGPYRLDFFCPLARLAVEVDGGSHLGREAGERDALRDAWHRARGIVTMRVAADHVERDLPGVVEEVRGRVRALLGQSEPPSVSRPPQAAGLPTDVDQQVVEVAEQVGLLLLGDAVSDRPVRAEQQVEALLTEACRTVLPAEREAPVLAVLRRAGLPVIRRA